MSEMRRDLPPPSCLHLQFIFVALLGYRIVTIDRGVGLSPNVTSTETFVLASKRGLGFDPLKGHCVKI